MSHSFRPHLEILPPAQKQLWPALKVAAEFGFVLYGGTAIALRLGHRSSVDFDFFMDQPLPKEKLRKTMPFLSKATVLQDSVDTLTILTAGVKVSFFGSIGFGRVGTPDKTEDGVLWVASAEDLLALKLTVILQRVEAKDYLDIVALVKSGLGLASGLGSAKALYRQSFQPAESLKALVYFEGGDLSSLSKDIRTTLIDAVRTVRELPTVKTLSASLIA